MMNVFKVINDEEVDQVDSVGERKAAEWYDNISQAMFYAFQRQRQNRNAKHD
jgi:hypothetical protein